LGHGSCALSFVSVTVDVGVVEAVGVCSTGILSYDCACLQSKSPRRPLVLFTAQKIKTYQAYKGGSSLRLKQATHLSPLFLSTFLPSSVDILDASKHGSSTSSSLGMVSNIGWILRWAAIHSCNSALSAESHVAEGNVTFHIGYCI